MDPESRASKCYLSPINLDDADEFTELRRQRLICGWESDHQTLESWKSKRDLKKLFWITVPDLGPGLRAGHISLDKSSALLEPGFLRKNEIELSLSSFFILPEYRALRLGKHAVMLLEKLATTEPYGSPCCRYLTLTALSKKYFYDEEWRGMWDRVGMQMPSFSIQEWYERLGYVSWKEEPLYEERTMDGEKIVLWEAFMKKDLWGL
ncbi:hypothetical protein N7532_011238 [Penicillium argentinense]|uniref:N-acetyltransferase domain-containing protein n=1 Tax=Penicillium argentinense TaxID=1131581 RepID=A0A9W9EI99_9EURO|nr:uncharacterized protein N7532_011238 [Penicillium argentinense]KAJ5082195.1 hypothetical protein N7532_011238 [Penicillium argentinense]